MRRRGRNPNENPGVRPVERIELDEKNTKRRMIATIILLALGLSLVAYSMTSWLTQKAGWVEITVTAASAESVAGDLAFQYELGTGSLSETAERKTVSTLYTTLCMEAYRIFSPNSSFTGVLNLCYVNEHPNEEIKVDPALYAAFELLEAYGNRDIYLAPLLIDYKNLFLCPEDYATADFDPYQNADVAAFCQTVADFARDKDAIDLVLLGDNKVKLHVSEEYLAFLAENGIDTYLDFYTMRNAFAVDYVAEGLIEKGFTSGNITSYDGFARNLDTRETPYSLNLFDRVGMDIFVAARMDYKGANAIVFLRSYRLTEQDDTYYMLQDGTARHGHIDAADGLCKNSLENLVGYSKTAGCSEILLSLRPVYIADTFDSEALFALENSGIHSIWFENQQLCHTEENAVFNAFFTDENHTYTKKPWN